jgi:hypothetical protein
VLRLRLEIGAKEKAMAQLRRERDGAGCRLQALRARIESVDLAHDALQLAMDALYGEVDSTDEDMTDSDDSSDTSDPSSDEELEPNDDASLVAVPSIVPSAKSSPNPESSPSRQLSPHREDLIPIPDSAPCACHLCSRAKTSGELAASEDNDAEDSANVNGKRIKSSPASTRNKRRRAVSSA